MAGRSPDRLPSNLDLYQQPNRTAVSSIPMARIDWSYAILFAATLTLTVGALSVLLFTT